MSEFYYKTGAYQIDKLEKRMIQETMWAKRAQRRKGNKNDRPFYVWETLRRGYFKTTPTIDERHRPGCICSACRHAKLDIPHIPTCSCGHMPYVESWAFSGEFFIGCDHCHKMSDNFFIDFTQPKPYDALINQWIELNKN